MSYYDEDFYEEPSEFETQLSALKESLSSNVKQSIQDELAALRKENTELLEFKKSKAKIEREYKEKVRELEAKQKDFERQLKKARLNELLGEYLLLGWYPNYTREQLPKCDKCNDKRKLEYTTPLGKTQYEECLCSEYVYTYFPDSIECYEFYQSKRSSWDDSYPRPGMYFSRKAESDYDTYSKTSNVYDGEPFEKAQRYGIVFLNKEICQKYCDWLNEKEKQKRIGDA